MTKKIQFLMSDTGGGHRAAAEAIRQALQERYNADVSLIDVFRDYSPFPWKYMPEFYPWLVKHSKSSWGAGYKLLDSPRTAKTAARGMYMTMETRLKRMYEENPADCYVSVHSVLTRPSLSAAQSLPLRPPFVVVVTDLVTTPMFWYDRRADRTLVPTQIALDRGLNARIPADKLRVVGLPVHPNFIKSIPEKADARATLGWDASLPTITIVGGGDGMGPIFKTARAINDLKTKCQLVVIAGRNKQLKAQLDEATWNQPTHIFGFVKDMPRLMAASDILVTKAGPGTICEACIVGLPMIIYDYIPGQEDGNVEFVVNNHAGAYCPTPYQVGDTVAEWLEGGDRRLSELSRAARRIAMPNAVWDIADEIWAQAQRSPAPNEKRNLIREFQEEIEEFARDYYEALRPGMMRLRVRSRRLTGRSGPRARGRR
jgi:1,2-diacylglycerol 3-beta-galactosyltransferase